MTASKAHVSKKNNKEELGLPGGPVAKPLLFHCGGTGLIPGQGAEILHSVWHGQKVYFFLKGGTILEETKKPQSQKKKKM